MTQTGRRPATRFSMPRPYEHILIAITIYITHGLNIM